MGWLALLKTLLQVSSFVSEIVRNKQLVDAGEAKLLNQQLKQINEKLVNANKARRDSVNNSESGGLQDNDGYKRD